MSPGIFQIWFEKYLQVKYAVIQRSFLCWDRYYCRVNNKNLYNTIGLVKLMNQLIEKMRSIFEAHLHSILFIIN